MIKQLKTIEPYFSQVRENKKGFELRLNDRDFAVGDNLRLMQFVDGKETGEYIDVVVICLLQGFKGLEDGYCILGIRRRWSWEIEQ